MDSRVQIKLRSGGILEGELERSVSGEGGKLAICLHPWSRLGGSMNDPCVLKATTEDPRCDADGDRVLQMLAESLKRLDYHVLRFNGRGVGRSSGWASFTGLAEGKDLEEVTAWGMEVVPDVRSVVIIVRNANTFFFFYSTDEQKKKTGILVRIAHCEPSPGSACAGQDEAHPALIPTGSAGVVDAVPHRDVCDGVGEPDGRPRCAGAGDIWRPG